MSAEVGGANLRTQKAAETRLRILRAARRVLAEKGSEGFTTRRVAALAGVSHGMCHYHFATRGELLADVVDQARQDWIDPLEKLVKGGGSSCGRMQAVISWMGEPATIEVMRLHQALYRFALDDRLVAERLAREYARWRRVFVQLFDEVAKELELDEFDSHGIGEAFASAADGLVQQQSLDHSLPTEALLTSLFERLTRRSDQGVR
jgi:AcrR family transcriptional regulator